MQVELVYFQPFCRNSVSKCALQPEIAKKNYQNLYFGVQGRLKSSMLTNLKSLLPVLVMISSMFVPICNRFHTRRANSGKMTSFGSAENAGPENARLENDRLKNGLILFWRYRYTARTAMPVTRWRAHFDPLEPFLLLDCNRRCAMWTSMW